MNFASLLSLNQTRQGTVYLHGFFVSCIAGTRNKSREACIPLGVPLITTSFHGRENAGKATKEGPLMTSIRCANEHSAEGIPETFCDVTNFAINIRGAHVFGGGKCCAW